MSDKSKKLLKKLMKTISCTHLDMGGKNKYALTHKSMSIIIEIEAYLIENETN